MRTPVLIIDVAHPARRPDAVEDELLDAWTQVRNSPSLRILKIVHGYGKSGKGGSTKELVRNWIFRHRSRMKGAIDGESYSVYDEATREMRAETGDFPDPDLGANNPGVTIVWVK